MTIERDIETALFDRVVAIASTLALPVEWPNKIFETPASNRYLQVRHFPNTPVNAFWGTEQVRIGILQVSVVWSSDDGSINPTEIAGQIIAYFVKGTSIQAGQKTVKIEAHPTLLSDIQDGQSATFPVSIPYRCAS